MSTVESDHQLASYHLRTGYQKRAGGIVYPSLGAIVSRELRLPCVLALPQITTILKTGDLVEMNGSTGEVRILERATAP